MSDVGVVAVTAALALTAGLVLGALFMRSRLDRLREADVGSRRKSDPRPEAGLSELVLERAPLAVLALNSSDEVLLANRRAHELGLVDRRGLVDPLREITRAARTRGKTTRDVSLPTVGLPPRLLQARVSALPLPDKVIALVIEDVTEARRVDDVRRDFVANVSHEIKTPVGALRLLADAATESLGEGDEVGPGSAEDARHFVARIAHESARLGRLVSELLDLSRLQGAEARPEPVPVDLVAVVHEAIDRAEQHADAKGITIVRSTPVDAVVPGVEHQLVTAVANLLDNAINYSPESTRVALAVRPRAGAWEVTVTDQGLGIPDADLDRIFERFYRVDPARSRATGGTGLGLAIVKHIVRNHGGEVRVWSSPGAGSSFTLRLPSGDATDVRDAGGRHALDDRDLDDRDLDDRDLSPAPPAPARTTETTDARHDPAAPTPPGADDVVRGVSASRSPDPSESTGTPVPTSAAAPTSASRVVR